MDLENALLAAVLLEGADKRGNDGEDCPLAVGGRAGLGTGRRRGIDDILIAAGDVGAVARGVERRHGEVWEWRGSCVQRRSLRGELGGRGGEKEEADHHHYYYDYHQDLFLSPSNAQSLQRS